MEENILNLITSDKIKFIGEGFISKSYKLEINKEKFMLLQGQIEDSYNCYSKSYNGLIFLFNNGNPFVKSIKVPFIDIHLIKPNKNNEYFKYGALIYKEIEGLIFLEEYYDKINKDNILDSLSKFLQELYSIPVKGIDISEQRNNRIKEFNKDILVIKNYFKGKNIDNINKFEEEYLNYINKFEDFHYIHGDLWQENMIISEDYQNLVGVVDFDNFGINDIAKDYASLLDFGFEFINILIGKTGTIVKDKNDFINRIKIYQKLIEIEDTAYILREKKLEHKLNSKLRRLKHLNLI